MAQATLYLGIDVSTTGVKSVLVDGKGVVVAAATAPLTLATPRPLWAEQEPRAWWAGVGVSVGQALAAAGVSGAEIACVGLTGQMHGLVLLDASGEVLRPAILWNDQRTAAECDEMRRLVGRERLIQVTGNDALPGFTAPKLLWVRRHEPGVYARIAQVLLPKDYVRYRLTGQYGMDVADGSGTILMDLRQRGWSEEICAALDLPRAWLPSLAEGPMVTGTVTAEAAAATGLAAGTPVVAGGGDQAAGAVGVGAIEPGIVSLVLGTSGVVFAPTARPLIEPEGRLHAFCHALPGRWHLMGVTLSAAGSLQWYRDTLAPELSFDALLAEAAQAPAGCDGLLFLPYLSGERTPYPDPLARGVFVGLTLRHRRAHLTRAVLEGVAFSLGDCFALLHAAGVGEIREVRVSGGGARSSLWRGILASVLNTPLSVPTTTEGAAYGAALLAGVGVGGWPDVRTAVAGITLSERTVPVAADVATYQWLAPVYRSLYPILRATFAALGTEDAPPPSGRG